jgi:hypothetical protein
MHAHRLRHTLATEAINRGHPLAPASAGCSGDSSSEASLLSPQRQDAQEQDRVVPGDRVLVEFSSCDLSRASITFRDK